MQKFDTDPDHVFTIDGQAVCPMALRQAPDCVTILNKSGRISFMNKADQFAFGIDDLEQVVGLYWWDLWPQSHRDVLKAAFKLGMSGKIATYWGHSADRFGKDRGWDLRFVPIPNLDGSVSSVMVLSREVVPLGETSHETDPDLCLCG